MSTSIYGPTLKNKITMSYTRSNTSVDWGPNIKSPEIVEHYQINYMDTGMMVSESIDISTDGLTLTRTNIWNEYTPQLSGPEIIAHYKTDTIIQGWIAERNAYNLTNNIVPSVPYTEFLQHEEILMLTGIATGPNEKI